MLKTKFILIALVLAGQAGHCGTPPKILRVCEQAFATLATRLGYWGLFRANTSLTEDQRTLERLDGAWPNTLMSLDASLVAEAAYGLDKLQVALKWLPEVMVRLRGRVGPDHGSLTHAFEFYERALQLGMLRTNGSVAKTWFRGPVTEGAGFETIRSFNRLLRDWPLGDRGRIDQMATAYLAILGPRSGASARQQITAIEGLIDLAHRLPTDDRLRIAITSWIEPENFASETVREATERAISYL